MRENRTPWVELCRTGDDLKMEIIKGLLRTAEIPVVVERTGGKDMPIILGVAAYGDYVLKVPPDQVELARALMEAPPEFPDDEE